MKEIELTPKAEEDLVAIWDYSFRQFGVVKADEYIGRFSEVFGVLSAHQVGTLRPELGEQVFALPVEQHVIFFIPSATMITVVLRVRCRLVRRSRCRHARYDHLYQGTLPPLLITLHPFSNGRF